MCLAAHCVTAATGPQVGFVQVDNKLVLPLDADVEEAPMSILADCMMSNEAPHLGRGTPRRLGGCPEGWASEPASSRTTPTRRFQQCIGSRGGRTRKDRKQGINDRMVCITSHTVVLWTFQLSGCPCRIPSLFALEPRRSRQRRSLNLLQCVLSRDTQCFFRFRKSTCTVPRTAFNSLIPTSLPTTARFTRARTMQRNGNA